MGRCRLESGLPPTVIRRSNRTPEVSTVLDDEKETNDWDQPQEQQRHGPAASIIVGDIIERS
jgi:hypothetical protein